MALRRPDTYNQYRGNTLTTSPAVEPVTVAEVKSQLRLDGTLDDSLIEIYIQAAREMIEEVTGLALITQTWTLTLDHWPNAGEPWWDGVREMPISELSSSARPANVLLPRYPLQSVEAVTADGDPVVFANVFIVDTQQRPGRLVVKRGATWPVVLDNANGISVEYIAGYGDTATDVPAPLRLAIMQMSAYMYEHRGDCDTLQTLKMSGAQGLVNTFKAARL